MGGGGSIFKRHNVFQWIQSDSAADARCGYTLNLILFTLHKNSTRKSFCRVRHDSFQFDSAKIRDLIVHWLSKAWA